MKPVTAPELIKQVIQPNYCSGCGVCTTHQVFKMKLNKHGQYVPVLNSGQAEKTVVCPFASHQVNENDLAQEQFDTPGIKFHNEIGYYQKIYAGYVNEGNFRKNGSSGGSVSWFTHQLLSSREVDYIVHVSEQNQAVIRFNYNISDSLESNIKASKSKYYPTTLEASLQFIKEHEGKYAVVGLPCFIKGINLLKKQDPLFEKRIRFSISLFCGHLKSTHYLSSLLAQFDTGNKLVKHFDFRHKTPGHKASDYSTKIVLDNGKSLIKNNQDLFGTNWGWGLFKLKACDYCDDIIGETADISFGDAWTPRYENDYLGTNIVVVRNAGLEKIIRKNIDNQHLQYEEISPETLIESQAGGFRHRREGLAYRLYLQQKKNQIIPEKRIKPEKIKSKKRRKLYKIRMQLQEKSFYSINYNNIEKLKSELMPLIRQLEQVYEHSAWTKFRLKLKKWLKK